MQPAFHFLLRAESPFRLGASDGDRLRSEATLHSDTLYSALSAAMSQLGWFDEWIASTVGEAASVRLSSAFPMSGDTLYVPPPRSFVAGSRWQVTSYVPLGVAAAWIAGEQLPPDDWALDPETGCVVALDAGVRTAAPFKHSVRSSAAVDRAAMSSAAPFTTGVIEFAPECGLWCAAAFASPGERNLWGPRLLSAFRLLGDTGVGGERSRGYGRFGVRLEDVSRNSDPFAPDPHPEQVGGWWLLSLYSPAPSDQVDWSRGSYGVVVRRGRIESAEGWGVPKLASRMVEEGSVVVSPSRPAGTSYNVAPEGFPHPVYRFGAPVSIPLPAEEQA